MTETIQIEPWQAAIFLINSIAALSLNSLMFYFVYRNRSLRTSFNFSLLNVCSADMLVSVNMMVSTIVSLTENGNVAKVIFCNITGYITLLSFVASVMGLAAVSFNRYFLVCHWKTYRSIFTTIGTMAYIAGAWVFSILISIPPLLQWGKFSYQPGKSICFVDWSSSISYMIFMISICFCGPLFITLLSLYFILRTKRKTDHRLYHKKSEEKNLNEFSQAKREQQRKQVAKEEKRITMSIVIITLVFLVAWGPFVILMFLESIGKQSIPGWIDFLALLLGFLNSTANPIVYMTLNANYRKEVKRLLSPCCAQGTSEDSDVKTGVTLEGTPRLTPRLLNFKNIKEEENCV